MAIKSSLPVVYPTLNLNFAARRRLDPRITFTRSSTATYFDANGVLKSASADVARFDHDPVTGESKGLLIEEQRTNLLTYSEQFDNAAWTTNSLRVSFSANATTAPDGTTTADKAVPNTENNAHIVRQFSSVTSGTTYSQSIFAKAGEYAFVQITTSTQFDGGGVLYKNFNLTTGSLGNGTLPATISPVGNGWYRLSVTLAATGTGVDGRFNINILNADTASANPTYTGDGTSGLYIWGAQLEAGAFPTSYIPTTSTSLTRSADVASMTGTNFSSWYNQSEGTLVVGGTAANSSTQTNTLVSIEDGTSNERIQLRKTTTSLPSAVVVDGGVVQASTTGVNAWSDLSSRKLAVGFALNNIGFSTQGETTIIDAAATVPTPDRMLIGNGSAVNVCNGHIARITYFPKRLSNTELQALTA